MIELNILWLTTVCMSAGWLGTAIVRRYAVNLKLISTPNDRSSHAHPMPSGGGLGIAFGGTIAGVWLMWEQSWAWWGIAGLALILAMVGLADDIRHLPARLRFAVQLLIVIVLLWVVGFVEGVGTLPLVTSEPAVAGLTISLVLLLAGVWWINLFNFMDGIDGIAGAQAIFMLLAAAGLGAWLDPGVMTTTGWLWMLSLAAATAGFLLLNWPPARIFMGDVGSTYLAMLIFGLALVSVRQGWLSYEVWIILGATFVVDATATLLRRMLSRDRWFDAHRSHTYQRLTRRFGSHQPVTMITVAINILWLAPLAWLSLSRPTWAWFTVLVAYLPLAAAVLSLGAGKKDHV
jgi:Fuc2NAc and GlcNAc transferase